ncbi:T6SS immunity protein Tli4 family protein [Achromobacter seleniivolatilans]|uniref:T6SS immunity protein Tli4 family protein n=1 Tax=Achromobacter seleniivolatilans TaxID=3047478 RepID=A0ABY9LZ92_9BURK|nr:T6SS immunity protein Tli4 family protein [Achromobacter sp. R39]WMD19594.1 T6SS immunity protein Tli4 family protein [Achromobacter sp. R39]
MAHSHLKENPAMSDATPPMQSWALGRHQVELPANWGHPLGGGKLYFGLGADHETVDVDLLGQDITQAQFDEALTERAQRISAVENSEVTKSMLITATELAPGKQLLQYYLSSGGTRSQTYELHIRVNGAHVMLSANAHNGNNAKVESRLIALAEQVAAIRQGETAGPGFALGAVIIRSAHDHEQATVRFVAPGSNVRLKFYISAVTPDESPRLIDRMARDSKVFNADDHEVLRKGRTTLAGNPAEEYLLAYEMDAHRELLFVAENYRDNRSLANPTINVRLTAGGVRNTPIDPDISPDKLLNWLMPGFVPRRDPPLWQRKPRPSAVDPVLSNEEIVAIWDHAIRSLRPRYGAVASPKVESERFFRGVTPGQAEKDRISLDAFIASEPGTKE